MTEFGVLKADGSVELLGSISQTRMLLCPNVMIAFEHYQGREWCRCYDPEAIEMADYGYAWNESAGRWS